MESQLLVIIWVPVRRVGWLLVGDDHIIGFIRRHTFGCPKGGVGIPGRWNPGQVCFDRLAKNCQVIQDWRYTYIYDIHRMHGYHTAWGMFRDPPAVEPVLDGRATAVPASPDEVPPELRVGERRPPPGGAETAGERRGACGEHEGENA